MPVRPARPCRYRHCPALTTDPSGYCDTHARLTQREADSRRESSHARGYTRTWAKVRAMQLARYPLCHDCQEHAIIEPATEVHHIIPLREGGDSSDENLMSLCKQCHSRRTKGFVRV